VFLWHRASAAVSLGFVLSLPVQPLRIVSRSRLYGEQQHAGVEPARQLEGRDQRAAR
jgi:hypothetical protein